MNDDWITVKFLVDGYSTDDDRLKTFTPAHQAVEVTAEIAKEWISRGFCERATRVVKGPLLDALSDKNVDASKLTGICAFLVNLPPMPNGTQRFLHGGGYRKIPLEAIRVVRYANILDAGFTPDEIATLIEWRVLRPTQCRDEYMVHGRSLATYVRSLGKYEPEPDTMEDEIWRLWDDNPKKELAAGDVCRALSHRDGGKVRGKLRDMLRAGKLKQSKERRPYTRL